MAFKVTIETIDKTSLIDGRSGAEIRMALNGRATAHCVCRPTLVPARFDDVVFYDQDGTTPIFGGVVLRRRGEGVMAGAKPMLTLLECGDYFTYLDWSYISLTYAVPVTTKAVLTAIVAALPAGYGITVDAGQVNGPTLAAFEWVNKRASDAVRELSERTNYVARMSAAKAIKLFVPGTDAAPYTIVDAAPRCRDLTWADSDRTPANTVILTCGPTGTGTATEVFTATGIATSWQTDIAAADPPPPTVYVDDGVTPITATVGAGAQFEWASATHTLSVGTYGTPAAGVILTLAYTAQYPFTVEATSGATPEIQERRSYPDLLLLDPAQELADALLDALDQQPREVSVFSLDHGWRPGQALTVNLTERAVNASFVITDVSIRLMTGQWWEYTFQATESAVYQGSYLEDWRELTGGGSSTAVVSVVSSGASGTDLSPVPYGGSMRTAAPSGTTSAQDLPDALDVPGDGRSWVVQVKARSQFAAHTVTPTIIRLAADHTTVEATVSTGSATASTTGAWQAMPAFVATAGKFFRLRVTMNNVAGSGYAMGIGVISA